MLYMWMKNSSSHLQYLVITMCQELKKIHHVQRAVGRNSVLLRFYHNSIFLNSTSGENPFRVVTYARNNVPTTKPCQASATTCSTSC